MSGWKDWQIGEVVEAAEFQTFLQDQVVQVYADSSARGSALGTAVAEGMASYVKDTDSFEVYDGTGWVPVSVDAAWVTAGTAGEILRSNGTADPSWVEAETTLTAGSAGALVQSAGTAGVTYSEVGTSGFTALSAGTAGISYQPVSHNYIMNGAFNVNQREFASATTTGYGFDRWLNSAVGDGTTTFTAESFTPGDAPVLGQESRNFLRVVSTGQTSSDTASVTEQRVEDVRTITPGTTWTVSFYARAATGSPKVATEFAQSFGAGGSAGVNTFIGQVTLTNSWQRFTQTVFLPTIAGKTVGLNSFTFLRFYFSAGSDRNDRTGSLGIQSNTFDIWGVQLEAGSVATPFKRHAPSLQGERAACQRYYYRAASGITGTRFGLGENRTTDEGNFLVVFPVSMRIAPTALEQTGTTTDYTIIGQTVNYALTGVPTHVIASTDTAVVRANVTGLTVGYISFLRAATTTAFLGWSAEL